MKAGINCIISFICFSAVLCILWGGAAQAEFYKYRDETGSVRFTDDLSMVPEDQRPDVKSYVETKSGEEVEASAPLQEEKKDEPESAEDVKAMIEERKNEIDAEFRRLSELSKALNEMKAEAKSEEEKAEYLKKVNEYNEGVKNYERARKTLEADHAKMVADQAVEAARKKAVELEDARKNQEVEQQKPKPEEE